MTMTVLEPEVKKGIWGVPLGAIPEPVAAARAAYREERGRQWLVGWGHFAAITLIAAGTTALSARMVSQARWREWAAVPAGFLIANFVEWLAHRYPMHHPMRPLSVMYEMHTMRHHLMFTEATMEAETTGDFDMVLFSPGSLAFFMLGAAAPIASLFFLLVSRNAGWLFIALALDYYALYEYFHLAYHLPEDSWVGRLPGMAALRRHHTNHHNQELMADWNFNVTFPIFDAVFGTHWERRR
jgi:hypothetical protein